MRLVTSLWTHRWRLPTSEGRSGFWPVWCLLSVLLVVLAPLQFYEGRPFWSAPAAAASQALLAGVGFLAMALHLGLGASRPDGIRAVSALGLAGAYAAAAFGVFTYSREDYEFWTTEFGLATMTALVLALLPLMFSRVRGLVGTASLLVGVSVVIYFGLNSRGLAGPANYALYTSLKGLTVTTHRFREMPARVNGGAIDSAGQSLIVMTAEGDFYRLDRQGSSLVPNRLPLKVPLELDRFVEDQRRLGTRARFELRATDMLLDQGADPTQVYVSYQHWDPESRCLTLRVAVAPLPDDASRPLRANWRPVFTTRPCLALAATTQLMESGGRLAWLGDRLLMTSGIVGVGDPGQQGFAQAQDNTYGKVVLLDGQGGAEIYSTGHRNPQGLLVARDGRIWLAEHGPRGGDEINLLQKGLNYGYPIATYGTAYGEQHWPLAPTARNHGSYEEPVYAFVPSIGPSNLIQVEDGAFPEWQGDLLMGSLIGQSVFRIRLAGSRVVYVERIELKERIRDLTQAPHGAIALLTDSGLVLTLAPASDRPTGASIYASCEECHREAPNRTAPSLRGIVGRPVASAPGYPYSQALRAVGGTWTRERLNAFLEDPDRFAPGSQMQQGRVSNAADRRALLELLVGLR
jgi:cytochrome c2